MTRRRLDAELVRRGLSSDVDAAREAVAAGIVRVGGLRATTPATMVAGDAAVTIVAEGPTYVSRGGIKLAAALDRFEVEVEGRSCLDAGASTGGFTDCLLRRGAAHVFAVDVGYGQLAWGLRNDPRVTVMERTNVRDVQRADLVPPPSLAVADLSFVSLRSTLPALAALGPDELVVLLKPQFEARPDEVGAGGIVREPAVWRRVLAEAIDTATRAEVPAHGVMASPIRGRSGNVEFLLHLRRSATETTPVDVEAAIADAGDER